MGWRSRGETLSVSEAGSEIEKWVRERETETSAGLKWWLRLSRRERDWKEELKLNGVRVIKATNKHTCKVTSHDSCWWIWLCAVHALSIILIFSSFLSSHFLFYVFDESMQSILLYLSLYTQEIFLLQKEVILNEYQILKNAVLKIYKIL